MVIHNGKKLKLGLALGSGGAKGAALIGALTVFEEENVNSKRVEEHLCDAIRIKTISHENEEETDWAEFDRFHEFLKKSFPLIYENLSVDDVSKASLL